VLELDVVGTLPLMVGLPVPVQQEALHKLLQVQRRTASTGCARRR
jgi:hypothetical protein